MLISDCLSIIFSHRNCEGIVGIELRHTTNNDSTLNCLITEEFSFRHLYRDRNLIPTDFIENVIERIKCLSIEVCISNLKLLLDISRLLLLLEVSLLVILLEVVVVLVRLNKFSHEKLLLLNKNFDLVYSVHLNHLQLSYYVSKK